MASLAARAAVSWLRRRVKRRLAEAESLEAAAGILNLSPPPGSRFAGVRRQRLGGIGGEWTASASGAAAASLLYLHGGAYFAGSARQYRPIAAFFARRGLDVFAPDYRLAPAHPFPAALEDARAAYEALRAQSLGPLLVAGDSAGGGLALALMLALRDAGAPLPRAAALFSPWTDLAVTGASTRENEESDALFTRRMLKIAARAYLGGASPRAPLASPLHADLAGLPPILVHVGAQEILRDDSTRLVARARAAGASAEIELWSGVPHGWQMAVAFMPEARESLEKASDFLLRSVDVPQPDGGL